MSYRTVELEWELYQHISQELPEDERMDEQTFEIAQALIKNPKYINFSESVMRLEMKEAFLKHFRTFLDHR